MQTVDLSSLSEVLLPGAGWVKLRPGSARIDALRWGATPMSVLIADDAEGARFAVALAAVAGWRADLMPERAPRDYGADQFARMLAPHSLAGLRTIPEHGEFALGSERR